MKFTKKNLFAIGGAVMMTASLASFASASIPAPASIPVHSDLSGVEVVDVDLSAMDFSEMLDGTPIAVASIDPESVPSSLPTATTIKVGVICTDSETVVNPELDEMDLSQALPGEVIVLDVIDAGSVVSANFDPGK